MTSTVGAGNACSIGAGNACAIGAGNAYSAHVAYTRPLHIFCMHPTWIHCTYRNHQKNYLPHFLPSFFCLLNIKYYFYSGGVSGV